MTSSGKKRVLSERKPRNVFVRALASWRTRLGLAMIVTVIGIALLGPLFSPYDPTELLSVPFDTPQPDFLFGTDVLGRDILSRFLAGGSSLVWMSLTVTALCITLGMILGTVAAFYRGVIDEIIMRIIDIKLAFPTVVLALLVVTMLGPGKVLLVILVGLSLTPGVTRVIRGAALGVIEQEYVQYARTIGLGTFNLIRREVLPNVMTPLLVELGLRLMWAISALAGLSFLGYGIQPPQADWGLMVNENRNALSVQPWAVIAPVVAIAIFTIGGNLFAEGMARAIGRTEGGGQ